MAREQDFWKKLDKAFDNDEILAGERGDKLYCEREHSPEEDMKDLFDTTLDQASPPVAFFSGHRGSGKSSLLARLLQHCHSNYFVVYYDIEYNLEKDKANQIDLLYLLGAAIHKIGDEAGVKPDPNNLKALHDSIYTLTDTFKEKPKDESFDIVELLKNLVVFGAGMVGSPVGAKLAEALLKPFKITSGVSEETAKSHTIEPQVQNIVNNVNLIIADVQAKAKKPLLVIVDGLDKINDETQAKLIFLKSRSLRGPRCRLIYTVPMMIQSMPEFLPIEEECKSYTLPNVKLFSRLDITHTHTAGYDTLREVVRTRLETVPIAAGDLFENDVVEYLILKSGGVMRWFISLVRDACALSRRRSLDKVDMTVAKQVVASRVADLTGKLTIERKTILQSVHENKATSDNPLCYMLLQSLFILAYRNDETWFDAHPLLWDYIKV